MLKHILLAVALLAPALAYSASPSTDLSVQIVPAATPTPPPSPTPSPPPPSTGLTPPTAAQTAGFTTLAANYDFSQPLYATQSNWLDCPDSNNPSLPWHWGFWYQTVAAPCSSIQQVTDPTYGNTVLDLNWQNSYLSQDLSGNGNFIGMMTALGNWPTTLRAPFSVGNAYIEGTYREDSTYDTGGNNDSGPDGLWTWSTIEAQGTEPVEWDITELWTSANGFADATVINHAQSGGGFTYTSYGSNNLPAGWSVTTYHKYGMLITSDGATQTYGCTFVDDVLQSCLPANPNSLEFTQRNFLQIWIGGLNPPTKNLYVENVHVWSCANWQNSICNGSTLYNSGGLMYWH